jgi:hypothetical protein
MSEELNSAVEKELEYGDSKAGWIREAIRMRLEAEGVDDLRSDGGQLTLSSK